MYVVWIYAGLIPYSYFVQTYFMFLRTAFLYVFEYFYAFESQQNVLSAFPVSTEGVTILVFFFSPLCFQFHMNFLAHLEQAFS